MSDPRQPDEILAALLLRWEEAWERGEDLAAEILCADCPEMTEHIRDRITGLKKMAWMTKSQSQSEDSVEVPDPLLGRTLAGRYRIETSIAEGGFGRVYRAFDAELQRHVALKVPKANRISSPEQADQLLKEARRAAKLRHPGIVAVHDVGRDDGLVFIVADLIEGQTLAEIILGHRPKPLDAAQIVAEVADALQFAHDQGFIHRDIKPANILMDDHGRPHITDFGIATTVEQVSRGQAESSGTLAYMAPEQLGGETDLVGTRTDIHALGVVFYELLTGKNPFDAENPTLLREQIMFCQPGPIASDNGGSPSELRQICLRCLSKHPSDRFESMAELAAALRSVQSKSRASGRKWWLIAPLIAASLGAAIWIGSGWVTSQNSQTASIDSKVSLKSEDGVFIFDGKCRIVTPVVSFAPCTLELWLRTTGDKREQFVVGSDVPNFYGIGIGTKNNWPIVETIRGGFHVEEPIPPGAWTHLAAVYGGQTTTIFLNGKKIGVGPATQIPPQETHFVVGNVGKNHRNLFFQGQIRSVRISQGERYLSDFTPQLEFAPDTEARHSAVLIFDGSKIEGDRVVDLSGNGNDGRWERP